MQLQIDHDKALDLNNDSSHELSELSEAISDSDSLNDLESAAVQLKKIE